MRKWMAGTALLCLALSASAGTITGTVSVRGMRKPQDILVFVEKVGDNKFKAPKEHAVMDQSKLVFLPYVLPVTAGTTVDFLNSDSVLHNVFTPNEVADKFNLGTWPQGQVRSYTFKRAGSAVVLCNVHPEMEGYVVVLKNPYFGVTDEAGHFTIPSKPALKVDARPVPAGLPAGTYRLHIWHPKLAEAVEEVVVPASGEASVSFALKRGKPENLETLYRE